MLTLPPQLPPRFSWEVVVERFFPLVFNKKTMQEERIVLTFRKLFLEAIPEEDPPGPPSYRISEVRRRGDVSYLLCHKPHPISTETYLSPTKAPPPPDYTVRVGRLSFEELVRFLGAHLGKETVIALHRLLNDPPSNLS